LKTANDRVIDELFQKAISLLKNLISTPSFSKEEEETCKLIRLFFESEKIPATVVGNNVFAQNKYFDSAKPTLLLNSHHDTVRPNSHYTVDPFEPKQESGKLFGLGSNDAGGALVSLMATFIYFYPQQNLKYNIVFVASAEEEISGTNGIELVWSHLPKIDMAIVGEPTQMEVAIAEKGLLVIDCVSSGIAAHAANAVGENAIYKAIKDIEWIQTYQFPKESPLLGKIKMSVTIINAGKAHNQIPATCMFTIDVRVTEVYSLEEVFEIIKNNISSSVKARSFRLKSSTIDITHPLAVGAKGIGKKLFGSPTTSDQALMSIPSIKMGPGDSARSHSSDEFIYLQEVKSGIEDYISLLQRL